MGVCVIFRSPVHGGSSELISKFLSTMILYNHSSYFKSGEINSCRLSPLPTCAPECLQHTLTATPTCSSHSGTALCETYVAGQRNPNV